MKQFDLEQSIMECWNVTSDIDMILECYDDLSEDSLLNLLIGMKEMYQLRFDKLFRTFEEMLAEQRKIKIKEEKFNELLSNKNEHLHFDENTFADYDTMLKSAYTYEDTLPYSVANTTIPNIPTIDLSNVPEIKVSVSS